MSEEGITTFEVRLQIAREKLRERLKNGEEINLTRSWSRESVERLKKALRGGPPEKNE